jgi:hypothetical protein
VNPDYLSVMSFRAWRKIHRETLHRRIRIHLPGNDRLMGHLLFYVAPSLGNFLPDRLFFRSVQRNCLLRVFLRDDFRA